MQHINNISVPYFFFGIIFEFLSAVFLGIAIDSFASYFDLSLNVTVILQILITALVLYCINLFEHVIKRHWSSTEPYGIIFVSVLLASQRNLAKFLREIYGHELSMENI